MTDKPLKTAAKIAALDATLIPKGMKDATACRLAGVPLDTIREIRRGHEPGAARWEMLANYLGIPVSIKSPEREISGIASQQPLTQQGPSPLELSQAAVSLPLRQQRGNGVDEPFRDVTVTEIPRPSMLVGRSDAYAVYVTDDEYAPFLKTGHTIYVDPSRPFGVGDWVRVCSSDHEAVLGVLDSRDSKTIRPRKASGMLSLPAKSVISIERIVASVFLSI